MTILANLFWLIAALAYGAIFSLMYVQKLPKSGDALMGLGWALIILHIVLLGGLLLTAAMMGLEGKFEWLGGNGLSRFVLIVLMLLTAAGGSAVASFSKGEYTHAPVLFKAVAQVGPGLISLLSLSGLLILNNGFLKDLLPERAGPVLCLSGAALGTLCLLGFWAANTAQNNRNRQAYAESEKAFQDSNHERILAEIDSCDVNKQLAGILVFTNYGQPDNIREAAVAKIKTHPQWQQEIAGVLGTRSAPEAFTFLASNEVPDKQLFPQAIEKGIREQAALIRESIQRCSHPSHFYDGMFCWELDKVLLTVAEYEDLGVDFRPAMQALRDAFNERNPSKPRGFEYRCAAALDTWILQH